MQNVIRPVNIQAILALEIKACLESLGQRIGVGADLCRRVDKWGNDCGRAKVMGFLPPR